MSNPAPDHVPDQPEGESAPATPGAETAESEADQAQRIAAALLTLEQAGRRGANWFLWVAGLSLVNSGMWKGLSAYRKLGALERALQETSFEDPRHADDPRLAQ